MFPPLPLDLLQKTLTKKAQKRDFITTDLFRSLSALFSLFFAIHAIALVFLVFYVSLCHTEERLGEARPRRLSSSLACALSPFGFSSQRKTRSRSLTHALTTRTLTTYNAHKNTMMQSVNLATTTTQRTAGSSSQFYRGEKTTTKSGFSSSKMSPPRARCKCSLP